MSPPPPQTNPPLALTRSSIQHAHSIISPKINRTPLLSVPSLTTLSDNQVLFKCENLQKTGSFKFRGATYSVSTLTREELAKGVCTHSSGNHAGALSWAAKEAGAKATIVMPEGAAAPKVANCKAADATVTFCAPTSAARESTLASIQLETGAVFIPPYDFENTILGQGTVFLEVEDQVKEEPEGADDCHRGLASGSRITEFTPNTIADGVRTPVGTLNFPIIQKHVESVLTVSDAEIIEAMHLIFDQLKVVAEPTGALAFAAARSEAFKQLGIKGSVAVVISGGNVDLGKGLPWLK